MAYTRREGKGRVTSSLFLGGKDELEIKQTDNSTWLNIGSDFCIFFDSPEHLRAFTAELSAQVFPCGETYETD